MRTGALNRDTYNDTSSGYNSSQDYFFEDDDVPYGMDDYEGKYGIFLVSDGASVLNQQAATEVSEPSGLLLSMFGLFGLFSLKKKRFKA